MKGSYFVLVGVFLQTCQPIVNLSVKKLTSAKLIDAIRDAQSAGIAQNVPAMGELVRHENGTKRPVNKIERCFT
jgi:hypothetical protein